MARLPVKKLLKCCQFTIVLLMVTAVPGTVWVWIMRKLTVKSAFDDRQTTFHTEFNDHSHNSPKILSSFRISCWIMTSPSNLKVRARFVQHTWAKRCDKVAFISSETDEDFPVVGINVSEGRDHLTEKTLGGYHYVYHNHFNECDWFLKADDDTYVIVENLRHFLKDKDPHQPIYYGHHLHIRNQNFSSGGSGMVVSKEALRRFGEKGDDPKVCRQRGSVGDFAFGNCMEKLDIQMGISTDSLGRSRFHCLDPVTHLIGKYPDWYKQYDSNGAKGGIPSMSDRPISFHYVAGPTMLVLEYFLYHVRVNNYTVNTTR